MTPFGDSQHVIRCEENEDLKTQIFIEESLKVNIHAIKVSKGKNSKILMLLHS